MRVQILIFLLSTSLVVEYGDATSRRDIKSCWATWSRCSSWSSIATGILWLRCDTCCKCMGKAGGTCVLKPSTCVLSSQAYQCDCYSHHLSERRPSECDSASNLIDGCKKSDSNIADYGLRNAKV
jgi:hypothetical protein